MSEQYERFGDLLEAEIESVKLETDVNGYVRVIFDDEELKEVNSYLQTELTTTYNDYQPLWANAVENLETYKAIKINIRDSGPAIYPAPLARIPADQVIASTYNAVVRPRPIFSIDAYLNAEYDVPQTPPPAMPGQPPPQPETQKKTAEDIAKRFRQGYEFIVRERIKFPQKLLKAIGGAVKGAPYWWKTVATPQESTKLVAKIKGKILDLDDKYESTRMRGDIIQHYLVPYWNGMMPLDQDDVATSPWFAERLSLRPDELIKKWAAKEYFLIEDEEEIKHLAANVVDVFNPFQARAEASTSKKTPEKPTQVPNVWLVWFYWTVNYKGEDGKTHTKRLNLVGDYHLGGSKTMNCFLNQYEHQERPYELMDQFEDGGSTVENMRYHQTVFTHCGQAEIKNAFHANNFMRWHDPYNSELVAYFKANPTAGPGDNVPGIWDKDWGIVRAGAAHESLQPLMQFILTMSQLDSKQSRYAAGDIPGRTPASTMSQAIEQAGQEPHLFLHRLSSKLSRIMRLDMETRRQFQPLGEVLPMWDQEAKATIAIPFQFPVGDVMDNFRVALTASDEALAKEADPQQIMANKQALMNDGEYVAKVVGPLLNTQTPLPQSAVALFAKIINRDQKMLMQLLDVSTTEEEAYDLTTEINALIAERNQQLQQEQQMQMEIQHAQMSGQAGQGQGQPPPQIKVSLSGKLTPEQEAAAAQQMGLGGQSAQMQPAGSAEPVPGGGTGNGGGSPQPGGQPAVPPNPNGPAPQSLPAMHGGLVQ